MKMTGFNAYQLPTSVKDIGEEADRDDADALGIGERNSCMNLVRGIFQPGILSSVLSRIYCILYSLDQSTFENHHSQTDQI